MKCIVIETSPERIEVKPVTNEDGTPHIYATMAEARAELKANGYSYNRENQRYHIKGTDYRAYIIREDSEEYAEIMEQTEQQQAPEYIEPEHIQTVNGNKIYRSIDPVTGWSVYTVTGRDFWELAEARYFAQCNPAEDIRAKFDNPYLVWDDDAAADPESLEEPAPIYQRYELLAYLGEPDDYDVDAIEAEATRFTADGARVWAAFGNDLAAIAERHELYQYSAV